jgi:hypothetical protein
MDIVKSTQKRRGRKEEAKEQEMERKEARGLIRVTVFVFFDGKEVATRRKRS